MLTERFLFFKDLIISRLLKRNRIYWATIYLTYTCNYRCAHCYGKYGKKHGPKYNPNNTMNLEELKQIVKTLHKNGCRYISLLGGEPLLHKDIKEIIRFIRSYNIELSIITNGSLVKKRIEDIKDTSTICLSIDGGEKSNNFLRGKGTFSKSIKAISISKKHRINTHINTTIYKKSIKDIDDLFEYAKKNKVYLGFCPLMYQSYQNNGDKALRPTDKDYREFYKKVIRLKKNNYPILFSNESYRTMLNWPDFNRVIIWKNEDFDIKKIGFPRCKAGKNFIYITPKGDICPCSQLVGTKKFSPKNIFKHGFNEAWQHSMNIPCKACTCIGFLNTNMILSFRIKPTFSAIKQTIKEYLHK